MDTCTGITTCSNCGCSISTSKNTTIEATVCMACSPKLYDGQENITCSDKEQFLQQCLDGGVGIYTQRGLMDPFCLVSTLCAMCWDVFGCVLPSGRRHAPPPPVISNWFLLDTNERSLQAGIQPGTSKVWWVYIIQAFIYFELSHPVQDYYFSFPL